MATLDQIISELSSTYQPQVDAINQRMSAIPGQLQAEEQGLDAKKDLAYGDIVNQARRRGTGIAFGGLPINEQNKYTATDYLPALARLRQAGKEQQLSLQDALNSIYEKRNSFAYQIKQNDDQLQESRRQFDANMAFQREQEANRLREAARAAAAANAMPTLGSLNAASGSNVPAAPKASYGFKNGKDGSQGFYFTNAAGQPISAQTYATMTGTNIISLLQKMGAAGDKGAANLYNSLRGPGITDQARKANQAFFWG